MFTATSVQEVNTQRPPSLAIGTDITRHKQRRRNLCIFIFMAASLVDFDILEQISMLIWAHAGDARMAVRLAEIKLAAHLWKKLTPDAEVEILRTETILGISKYVKEHPEASQEELSNEVEKHLLEFAKKVEQI